MVPAFCREAGTAGSNELHRHSSAYSCPLSSEREFNAPVPVCQGKVRCFRAWFRHRSFLPFLLRSFCDFLMIEVVADHGRLTEGRPMPVVIPDIQHSFLRCRFSECILQCIRMCFFWKGNYTTLHFQNPPPKQAPPEDEAPGPRRASAYQQKHRRHGRSMRPYLRCFI